MMFAFSAVNAEVPEKAAHLLEISPKAKEKAREIAEERADTPTRSHMKSKLNSEISESQ